MGTLENHLRAARDGGRTLLMPYLTAGVTPDWADHLRALAEAGADAIEIGLPFSDPTLDGVTIQRASHAALVRGATVRGILAELATLDLGVPLVASTYHNLVVHHGAAAFCAALREAGVTGLIVADLPVDEAGEPEPAAAGAGVGLEPESAGVAGAGVDLESAAAGAGIDLVLLASPATPAARLDEIAARSRGFVYAVSLMGTTGERGRLAESAAGLAARLKRGTDRPVMLGFGISTPEQAVDAARNADGVVIGAAIMRRILDGAAPGDMGGYLSTVRRALDAAPLDVAPLDVAPAGPVRGGGEGA